MQTAPRDGTVIEVKCTYGVAPWYRLFKWTDEYRCMGQASDEPNYKGVHEWRSADLMCGIVDTDSLYWRPYAGTIENYIDPTGGVQDDMAYWRGAVAAKYGYSPDLFEKTVTPQPAQMFGLLGKMLALFKW